MRFLRCTSFLGLYLCFQVIFCYLLRHCWYIAFLSKDEPSVIYPRLHSFIVLVGKNACDVLLVIVIVSLIVLVYYLLAIIGSKVKFFVVCASSLFTVLACEIVFRIAGFVPGTHSYSRYFTPVEKLIELNGFTSDEAGVFKVSDQSADVIASRIKERKKIWDFDKKHEVVEVFSIANDNIELLSGNVNNSFSAFYFNLLSRSPETLSDLDSVIINYIETPINSDGFRSIPFAKYKNNKPSILLIGDSFTWGHTTSNKSYSFADELLAMGYTVYNTGISGADVPQYRAIAQKYVPLLKPDYVIVNFYIGNDIAYFKRNVIPYQPVFYPTNAGNLMAFQSGVQFTSALNAYENIVNEYSIVTETSAFNKLFSLTVFSTYVWKGMYLSGLFPYLKYGSNKSKIELNRGIECVNCHNMDIAIIQEVVRQNGGEFLLSSIPEVFSFKEKKASHFDKLFRDIRYVEMEVDKSDYNLNDAHFNEKGHRKYALFLDSLVRIKEARKLSNNE